MLYGLWIGVEYFQWIIKGRLFVRKRGQMRDPDELLGENSLEFLSGISSSKDVSAPTSEGVSTVASDGNNLRHSSGASGKADQMVKRKSKRKSKRAPTEEEGGVDTLAAFSSSGGLAAASSSATSELKKTERKGKPKKKEGAGEAASSDNLQSPGSRHWKKLKIESTFAIFKTCWTNWRNKNQTFT